MIEEELLEKIQSLYKQIIFQENYQHVDSSNADYLISVINQRMGSYNLGTDPIVVHSIQLLTVMAAKNPSVISPCLQKLKLEVINQYLRCCSEDAVTETVCLLYQNLPSLKGSLTQLCNTSLDRLAMLQSDEQCVIVARLITKLMQKQPDLVQVVLKHTENVIYSQGLLHLIVKSMEPSDFCSYLNLVTNIYSQTNNFFRLNDSKLLVDVIARTFQDPLNQVVIQACMKCYLGLSCSSNFPVGYRTQEIKTLAIAPQCTPNKNCQDLANQIQLI